MLACPAGIDRDCIRPAWAFGLMVGCSGAAAAEGGAAAGAAAAGAWDSCIWAKWSANDEYKRCC